MSQTPSIPEQSICHRKERRYRTSEERILSSQTLLEDAEGEDGDGHRQGTVVDLSTTGIRMLCEGNFKVGQSISMELTTDRSHGVYRGVVRRVEPWVAGQSILGCSLNDTIDESVLQDLADEGFVNRRADGRVNLTHNARVSWQLNAEKVDVEIRDYSDGGMKVHSPVAIPSDTRLRFEIDDELDEGLVVEAKLVWKKTLEDKCVVGVAFTHRDAAGHVAAALGVTNSDAVVCNVTVRKRHVLRNFVIAASCVAGIGVAIYLNRAEIPWGLILPF